MSVSKYVRKEVSFEEKFILNYWVDIFAVVVSLSYFSRYLFQDDNALHILVWIARNFIYVPRMEAFSACVRLSLHMSMYLCVRIKLIIL